MCSLFALMLPLIIGYDDPSTSIELTAKETRLIEVQSNWYQTVDIKGAFADGTSLFVHQPLTGVFIS